MVEAPTQNTLSGLGSKIDRLIKTVSKNGLDSLPDDDPDGRCNICNGHRHINTLNGVQLCKCAYQNYNYVHYKKVFGKNYGHGFSDIESLPRFQKTKSYQTCKRVFSLIKSKGEPKALVLCGGHGRGKTYSSCALLKELTEIGFPCYGFSFPSVVYHHRKGFDGASWVETHEQRIRKNRFIFCDELSNDEDYGNPEIPVKALRYICRTCEESDPQKWLIITTNKSEKEIFSTFPSDIKDRFHADSGYCKYIEEPKNRSLRQDG